MKREERAFELQKPDEQNKKLIGESAGKFVFKLFPLGSPTRPLFANIKNNYTADRE